MKDSVASVAVRGLADTVVAVTALAAGLAVRLCVALLDPHSSRQPLLDAFQGTWVSQGPLLAIILTVTFGAFGVYTHTRLYIRRFKAIVLFQAISLAYAVFILAVNFSGIGGGVATGGALLIAYVLTLVGAMGSRLIKDYVDRRFTVELKRPSAQRPVHKILVVGGAGYIGSVLVRDLLAHGYQVRVLDSLVYGEDSIRELYTHPRFELIRGDFRHVGPVVQAVKAMDAVIHLGAIVGDPACAVNEDETLETNLAATRLLADVCRASGVSRILFASTCSVYGAADHLVDERSESNPVSLYAATKIDSERVLLAARDRHFHPVVLRLATAFGWSYRPRFDLVVNLLTAKAVAEKKILIYNGEQWRPFIHVADISRAFRMALTAPLAVVSGEVFNVGSNSMNFTLQQLAEQIAALAPDVSVEYVNNSDSRNYRVSFDRIRAKLGFDCRVSLAEGIAGIREALAQGLVTDYRSSLYSNVQFIVRLRELEQQQQGPAHNNGGIELTALRFAKNSLWWRFAGSSDALFRNSSTGLAALTRGSSSTRQNYGLSP